MTDEKIFNVGRLRWLKGSGTDISEDQRNALVEMARFIRLKAEEKAKKPGKDLMTEIVFAEVDGERLSPRRSRCQWCFLFSGGT